MAFEQTWRWFGPNDPYSLKVIRQTGATGIVSALHQIPVGNVWTVENINERKQIIENEGLSWSVVESLPVHENIKKRIGNYKDLIENYKTSIKNLAECGIDTICYNFMPVLDWSRTELRITNPDGTITSKFDYSAFRAFDLFILNRKEAEEEFTKEEIAESELFYKNLTEDEKNRLIQTVLYGLPGSLEAYSLNDFRHALSEYSEIGTVELKSNLFDFIKEITPAAEENGVFLGIHPDDPPWSLLGLPRVVSTAKDIEQILKASFSPSNGITFCTGSFGANTQNDLVEMVRTFSDRINFIHLRNVKRNNKKDFIETYHLEGEINLYLIVKELLIEQQRRNQNGSKNSRMPMRPDHGHLMIPDFDVKGIYPGYSLFGRMRGLAELRGLELGIMHELGLR